MLQLKFVLSGRQSFALTDDSLRDNREGLLWINFMFYYCPSHRYGLLLEGEGGNYKSVIGVC